MADLAELDAYAEDETISGHVFLFRWIKEGPWGEAARGVLWQLMFFYIMMLIGFGFLYLMFRSTAQLRELRRNVAETLRSQQTRRFDLDDYKTLPYGGMA